MLDDAIRELLGSFAGAKRCGPKCDCHCGLDAFTCCHLRKIPCMSENGWALAKAKADEPLEEPEEC